MHQPHDKIVRRLLANKNVASELLAAYLPQEMLTLVDLSTLERQADSFVDAEHRFLEVDILFKVRYKSRLKEGYIWLLIEQQRKPDLWMPLRLFRYLGAIWDHVRKAYKSQAKANKLPFIYPLIISNASKPYPYSLSLRDLIEPLEARPLFDKLFQTPAPLIDLAAIADEVLRSKLQDKVSAHALLLSLKHVFDKDFEHYLETVLNSYLQEMLKKGYTEEVIDLIYYAYNTGKLTEEGFRIFLQHHFSPEIEDKVMGLGEQKVQRALKQGVQQGVQQGLRATALRMLEKNVPIEWIAEFTCLSEKVIQNLAASRVA